MHIYIDIRLSCFGREGGPWGPGNQGSVSRRLDLICVHAVSSVLDANMASSPCDDMCLCGCRLFLELRLNS